MSQPISASDATPAGLWRRLARLAGLDAQVFSTLLFRSWSVVAGAVTVLMMPIWLGQVEQGYYYTFASLLALQVFFELGMNQVIMQLVSHDFAHVEVSADGRFAGNRQRLGRLASLVRLLRRWYLVAATAFMVLIGAAGAVFFSSKGTLPVASWLGAWFLVSCATAANLYLSVALTVLEGCGEIAKVARLRLVQSMIGYALMWSALSLGAKLWAVPLIPLAAVTYTAWWLRREGSLLNRLRAHPEGALDERIHWRTDIFPFQWRIALSWISGYFIFNLFTPLTFARQGAVEAGRLGIALAIFNALLTVGMSWVNAKVPAMAAHVSRHERGQLNAVFNAVAKRSLAFTLLAILLVVGGLQLLVLTDVPLAARIASVPVLACLGLVTLINGFIFAAAGYMRAHKEEPMLWVSLASGLATLLAALVGIRFSVLTMMMLYAAVVLFISLPWTLWLFRSYYRRSA